MSIKIMDMVWSKFPGAGSELLVMLAMADWCNDVGASLYPSIATVAGRIRSSPSQARRVVHRLIEGGWLAVVGNANGGAPGTTRRYSVNISKLADTPCVRGTPGTGATPRIDAEDGSHRCAEAVGTDASLTVKKQPLRAVYEKKELASRGSRLPADWSLPTEWKNWACEERPDLQIGTEAAKFAEYWHAKAGKDGLKADWEATWRNWIRRAHRGRHIPAKVNAQHSGFVAREYGRGGLI